MENLKNIEIKTLRKNAQRAVFEGIKAADPEIALNTALERNPIPPITADAVSYTHLTLPTILLV